MKKAIVLSIFLIAFCSLFAQKNLTVEEIWASPTFNAKSIYGIRSMSDGLHYTQLDEDKDGATEINKYSYKTGEKVATILSSKSLIPQGKSEPLVIDDYTFSADENKVLIATDTEPIYRHSTKETYYVYDLKSKQLQVLSVGAKQRYATFSPKGNQVAFVKDNDLYIRDLETGVEHRATGDGEFNKIINGATDWVYEEEFAFDKAFFWSPDGKKLAYYRFDESKVKEFSMDMFEELYPSQSKFKYPKAGEENAKVTIHIYEIATRKTLNANLGTYEYIPRIKWTKDSDWLSVQRMNRHQNKLELVLLHAVNAQQKVVIKEENKAYIDISDNLTFLDDKKHFIWSSEKSGFNHLYLYNIEGQEVKQITTGNWDVTEYLGYDLALNTIYYISAEESPMERHLYSIKLDGTGKKKLTTRKGTNEVMFSEGFKFYMNFHSDANNPNYITLHDASGKEIRVLENNAELKKTLETYSLAKKEFFKFSTTEGVELNGWMIKPKDFDAKIKYPVLMYVYGGPGSQTVQDSWDQKNYIWYQMLAQKGYIIISVDNRGTGARGEEFKKMTYKELGKYEVIDQIETAKYMKTLPYVDGNRIGIWGWSYGGYMSSNCLAKGADVFKMAMAVAPVTNWRFYDSIYTERYMQTPQENPTGYDENSPINHVDKIKGKYLLIHGTADDNVHYQNAVEMNKALINANIQFDFMAYPNKNHSIYGGKTRLHLYTLMTNFVLENL